LKKGSRNDRLFLERNGMEGEKNMELKEQYRKHSAEEENWGNNELVGYFEDYAIVYEEETEKFYYYESEVIESMIGCCVVVGDYLRPLTELPENVQEKILEEYGR
jgi:hypothetical protein